jgi:hypothetical protein
MICGAVIPLPHTSSRRREYLNKTRDNFTPYLLPLPFSHSGVCCILKYLNIPWDGRKFNEICCEFLP